MAENTTTKKYFWLKLKDDFFRDKKIKKLRRIAGGDTFTIIYLKMQLLSLKNSGKLIFDGVEENFVEELALELDEEVDNVKMTVAYLMSNNLLEEVETDEYILPQTIECIGSESTSAARVRKHRKKKKELQDAQKKEALPEPKNGQVLQCNAHETKCNTEIEKEKEKEIEKETDKQTDIELNPMQMKRVELLREVFVGLDLSDYQIFYLSTLVNKRLPYDPTLGVDGLDLKIYHILDELVMRAKVDNVTHIYRWMLKVIPVYEGIE